MNSLKRSLLGHPHTRHWLNRVEPFQASLERLQTIAWRHPQVAKLSGIVQIQNVAPRCPPEFRRKFPHFLRLPIEE
jgi:hypothetical protein